MVQVGVSEAILYSMEIKVKLHGIVSGVQKVHRVDKRDFSHSHIHKSESNQTKLQYFFFNHKVLFHTRNLLWGVVQKTHGQSRQST